MSFKKFLRRFSPRHQIIDLSASLMTETVCVDVGASYYPHIQWQPFLLSPRTTWITVEPNEKNLGYVKQWRWPCRVKTVPTGLSRHGGKQELHVTNVDSGSSLLPPLIRDSIKHRLADPGYFFPVNKVSIDTLTLADVVRDENTKHPILVKLDTQGTELDILRGAQDLFDQQRIVGIELEASLLSEPWMNGSGKFWQASEYLESQGFELVHLKPIQGIRSMGGNNPNSRRYLNECDAIFTQRRDQAARLSIEFRIALLGIYISYALYEEAFFLIRDDEEVAAYIKRSGRSPDSIKSLLKSLF